ncbi:choice-of-anchor G family protein, partial [Brachybacterium phenoliresistens]|uniref:choice-of-anchor G family protein n=1 Tax=Brachybacterium phenoliresistens TaxID=396014 RepID=UPI00056DE92D
MLDTRSGPASAPRPSDRRVAWRPKLFSGFALGVVCTLVGSSSASALGLNTYPDEPTEAEASIAGLELGGEDLLALAQSDAGSVSNPGPNREPFSGDIAGGEVVDFGNGITIPLDQLLAFGEVGVIQSEATATDGQNGDAISGIAGADGGLTLDGTDSDFGTAQIDLLSVFDATGTSGITDQMIDQADLSFGLGGAHVTAEDGTFLDPDGVGGAGQYRIGELKLNLHSPAIEDAGAGVSDAAGQMEDAVVEAINAALNFGTLLPGMTVETEVTSTIQEDVMNAILLDEISTDDGLATINLGEGTLEVDLGRIGGNDDGVIDRPVGLNNQDPNTELIDSDTYPFVASSVHDVIEEVITLAVDTAIASLDSVNIHTTVTAIDGTTASWDMTLAGEVSNYECNPAGLTGFATCTTIDTVVGTMGTVMAPVNDALSDPSGLLYDAFTTIKTDMITVPVRAAVDPFLELIAANVFSVQINHQREVECTTADGQTTLTGLEVSALSFGVAGGAARLGFGNAGVRIDACGTAITPEVQATSPVPAGGESEITSGGWSPNTEVSVQLTGPDGNPVGDPIPVTTDANGDLPAGTVVPIPEDAAAGAYTITLTDPDGNTGDAAIDVYAPVLEAGSPTPAGGESPVTSTGWLPNDDVTLQLTAPDGSPVGDPVVVTTDADGNVPEGTVVPVPEDAAPGADYSIVGTDPQGATVQAPLEVTEAGTIAPVLEASSPVPAGGETELTSSGWAPGSEVSFQLVDPSGAPLGDPIPVTTDDAGAVPAGTMLPVPADAPAGAYTVTGTDADGNSAEAAVDV